MTNYKSASPPIRPGLESARREVVPDRPKAVIKILSDSDIVTARQKGRALGAELGFEAGDLAIIATAISELARNIVLYGSQGEIALSQAKDGGRQGIAIVSRDEGPGIADVAQAMRDGYSTSGGLGLGLPGVKRLMDEFGIVSAAGQGTTVTIKKWKR